MGNHCSQSTGSVGVTKAVQLCSTAQNVGTVNITTASSSHNLQQSPLATTTINTPLISLLSSIIPHISVPSLMQSLNSQGAVSSGSSNVMPPKPATVKSDHPFILTVLTNRIKKCSGCGLLFCRSEINGAVPDYILGHMERDWFPNNGQWQLGRFQNKYYHLQKSCILQRCAVYQFPKDLGMLKLTVPLPIRQKLCREFGLEL